MVNLLDLQLEEITDIQFNCSCGQYHEVDIGDICIGKAILGEIPEILSSYKGKRLLLVADRNTYQVAGQQVIEIIEDQFIFRTFIYEEDYLIADAKSVGQLLMEVDNDIALILTIGSGTLNDITRYVSAKTKIPYVIIATAPSMDGYASTVSPLIRNGVKTTFKGVYPIAIIGDTEIMKEAPMHMLQAGLGDVLGKYTGLADWKMSNILGLERNEPYCDNIANLVRDAVNKCVKVAPNLASRSDNTIDAIMEGLILSGLCIGLAGHSRPASGSEHQIAHYIEMIFLQKHIHSKWLHGNKVGMATLAVLEAYDYLFNMDIQDILSKGEYETFDKGEWFQRIERCYGNMSKQIFDLKERELLVEVEKRRERVELIVEKWDDIKNNCYSSLPSPEKIGELLKETGAIDSPKEMGIDRELFKDSLMVSKEIRNRYGIMQLLDDLGMLEEAAEHITDKYYGDNEL